MGGGTGMRGVGVVGGQQCGHGWGDNFYVERRGGGWHGSEHTRGLQILHLLAEGFMWTSSWTTCNCVPVKPRQKMHRYGQVAMIDVVHICAHDRSLA